MFVGVYGRSILAGGLKVLGCCGLLRFQICGLVGRLVSCRKDWVFVLFSPSVSVRRLFSHRLLRPFLVLAFVRAEGWLVGEAAVSGGWCCFGLLVVC
ncbi:hypothetical protein MtrunA17_Chr8g0387611 [Medicago truncatula]|uniref:Uncharacterized protein n=1 Tax=Medicago truncatula TaxID=3880 RepID=A0A396GQH8_MEDTR|nr:hypothetical protein MtrunA17_Chr8g0387611 [Medicago truncatula]